MPIDTLARPIHPWPLRRPILLDHVGALLPNRIARRLQMRRDLQGHDTGVRDPEPLDPIHAQPGIHDAALDALGSAHGARAHGMPIRDGGVADPLREIGAGRVDVDRGRGREDAFLDDAAEGRGAADLVRKGLAEHHAPEVDLAAGALVVFRVDDRFVLRPRPFAAPVRGRDVHAPLCEGVLEHHQHRCVFLARLRCVVGVVVGGVEVVFDLTEILVSGEPVDFDLVAEATSLG